MKNDPIVDEVRRARERIAAKFSHDLAAIAHAAQRAESKNPKPKFTIGKDGVVREVGKVKALVAK